MAPLSHQPQPTHVHPSALEWSREDNINRHIIIGTARERRKIQNRINQRNLRSRRRNDVAGSGSADVVAATDSCLTPRDAQTKLPKSEYFQNILNAISIRDIRVWENHALVRGFETLVYNSWLARAPKPALLPALVKFNVARAMLANGKVLGITDRWQLEDDAISIFSLNGPWLSSLDIQIGALPKELQPTALQRRTAHHPWIDLVPIPTLRDNLLRRGVDNFDEDALCQAMFGHGDHSYAGLLVWSDPWSSSGWEVTEEFARSSWAWTIAGCCELQHATDKWREVRGEPALFK
ncbi:hypothetical protein F4808DRAFT_287224 [Astrocystis sublimbata]|nr:hypothetical protein F4808DRAFT_287224 [Astrocystis sublimbata]